MTLVEFLTARLRDDEAWADNPECDQDPARVLREVEAKRRIVAEHKPMPAAVPPPQGPAHGCETCHHDREEGIGAFGYCDTLKLLALPYDDHPDYREAWRP